MKRLLVFVFLLPIICTSQYTLIPDTTFELKLINLGYDSIQDGQVLTANIVNVDSLDLSGDISGNSPSISDLTGIEGFTNLVYLDCSANPLASLDVSQNIHLNYLDCSVTPLFNLDVSQNTLLKHLACEAFMWLGSYNGGFLQNLDLSNNDSLEYLNCNGQMLSNLDLSNNLVLLELYCTQNQLQNLDLSQNLALTHLDCSGNDLWGGITHLNLSQNTALEYFKCKGNTIFGSAQGKLRHLDIRNGNNINFTDFEANNNDSLYCISVDDSTWASNNWSAYIDSQTVFSNNCNPSTIDIIENLNNFLTYPNPTNNLIQIEIENYNGSIEAALYDFTGKLLETTNSTKLSLVNYPKGIYLLKVAYGDRTEEVKVVKE